MNADETIEQVVETIRDRYQPEKIILFGSRVWGQADSESDLDLLVIKESEKREVSGLVRRFQQRPYLLPLDILVKTPQEMEERLAMGDDFIREIVDRGRVVYERAVVRGVGGEGRSRLPGGDGA